MHCNVRWVCLASELLHIFVFVIVFCICITVPHCVIHKCTMGLAGQWIVFLFALVFVIVLCNGFGWPVNCSMSQGSRPVGCSSTHPNCPIRFVSFLLYLYLFNPPYFYLCFSLYLSRPPILALQRLSNLFHCLVRVCICFYWSLTQMQCFKRDNGEVQPPSISSCCHFWNW